MESLLVIPWESMDVEGILHVLLCFPCAPNLMRAALSLKSLIRPIPEFPLLNYEHELQPQVSFEPQTKSKLDLDADPAPSPRSEHAGILKGNFGIFHGL